MNPITPSTPRTDEEIVEQRPRLRGRRVMTFEQAREVIRCRFDQASEEIMADLPTGDASPELELAMDAAIDILARAMIEVRSLNAPA